MSEASPDALHRVSESVGVSGSEFSRERLDPPASETAVEDPPERQLVDQVADLSAAIAALASRLDAEKDRAAARERVIERLHDENQQLRAGERQLVLRPLLTSLQRMRSELLNQAAGIREPLPPERSAALFESFAFTIEQALEAHGVVTLRPEPGVRYDPAAHRVVRTEATDDPARDGTVGAVVEDGYTDLQLNRPMRHASVIVLRYAAPTTEPPKEATE